MSTLECRFCKAPLSHTFVDLGSSPLANSYLAAEDLLRPELFYPLCVYTCESCWLVQLPAAVEPAAIFTDYAYFSSYSDTWLEHARRYAEDMTARFSLGPRSRVVEVASNDGYLLRHFKQRGIPVLGVEPALNVARVAEAAGIPTRAVFFGARTARELVAEGLGADLLVGNNVFAHVPDVNDFLAGLQTLLKPTGVLTLEFPHLAALMQQTAFDTIYHEHYSYLALPVALRLLEAHGLTVFDVEELATHGGSLRLYGRHAADTSKPVAPRVEAVRRRQLAAGVEDPGAHQAFAERVAAVKRELLGYLIAAREARESVAGYGAPAKGNTLLNHCGVRSDLLAYTVDRNPHKQGRYLPGTRIPIHGPDRIRQTRPDVVLILPWNIKDEVMEQMADVFGWGGRFVVPIPRLQVFQMQESP